MKALALVLCLGAAPVSAQELSALARLDAAGSAITGGAGGIELSLGLSQPVPWRVRVRDDPPRLVLDLREVDWTGLDSVARPAGLDLRAGVFRPGWSRLVLELPGPMLVARSEMVLSLIHI